MAESSMVAGHLQTLTLLSLLSRGLVAALIIASTYSLPLFDSSPNLVLNTRTPPWISSLVRWDAFHFVHVAQQGHVYEHTWAFFPALPLIIRTCDRWLSRLRLGSGSDVSAALFCTAVLAALCDPTHILYHLSLHHLRSPDAAFLAAALSLLSSSPATLRFAPYNEPFFTYCSYRGMWACARMRWLSASVWFALSSAFRSNGVFLAGFVVWGMLIEPCLSGQRDLVTPARVLCCTALAILPVVPFAYHNYTGYAHFCVSGVTEARPEWCNRLFPSIYSHVQRTYWNVGFLKYWTVSNIPNFVLALPVLLNVYAFCAFYLSRLGHVYPRLLSDLRSWVGGKSKEKHVDASRAAGVPSEPPSLFLAPSLLPHVLHALALTLLLTLNAHVQIALRVLPSVPLLYWAAARLLIERPQWGKVWVAWSIVWGAVSCVLWAVFLPPA